MDLTFAHYRNRFCMLRTYYALAVGKVKPDGLNMKVVELPDPPSHEQEEALIRGDVQVANLYLPNFLRRKLQGAPIIGLAMEWKSMMKGNGIFVLRDGPIKEPKYLTGKFIVTHQGSHAVHRYLEQIAQANPKATAIDPSGLVLQRHSQRGGSVGFH